MSDHSLLSLQRYTVCDVGGLQQSREIVGIDCYRLATAPRVLHGQTAMPDSRSKLSAGTLLYRFIAGTALHASADAPDGAESTIEVLLVHPAGNYNRRAPWGIPKGAPDPDEELEATARRETLEETGLAVEGPLVDLGHVDYTRSKKRVHAFAGRAPDGAAPRCASWEVDKVEFIEITRARRIIHPDQAALLDRLRRHLAIEPVADEVEKTTA